MSATIRLLVLLGPTVCAKTRTGVEVAHAIGSEIVSADSRQVYRALDVGTGKDRDEYRRVDPAVPVHLIDVAAPTEVYTVFHYQRDCYRLLAEKARVAPFRDGRPLVMVGGSGLYAEAVLRAYRIANVPEDQALREPLMRREHAELVDELRRCDPALGARTDLGSKKRVVRALEIAAHAARGPVQYSEPPPVAIESAVFCVRVPPQGLAELDRRIAARLDARLGSGPGGGLIEEVEGLLAAGVPRERLRLLGLEYREVTDYLAGAKTREQMRDDLRRGICRFARRQQTWFRGLPRRGLAVTWIDAGAAAPLLAHPWAVPPRA